MKSVFKKYLEHIDVGRGMLGPEEGLPQTPDAMDASPDEQDAIARTKTDVGVIQNQKKRDFEHDFYEFISDQVLQMAASIDTEDIEMSLEEVLHEIKQNVLDKIRRQEKEFMGVAF